MLNQRDNRFPVKPEHKGDTGQGEREAEGPTTQDILIVIRCCAPRVSSTLGTQGLRRGQVRGRGFNDKAARASCWEIYPRDARGCSCGLAPSVQSPSPPAATNLGHPPEQLSITTAALGTGKLRHRVGFAAGASPGPRKDHLLASCTIHLPTTRSHQPRHQHRATLSQSSSQSSTAQSPCSSR